MKLQFLLLLLIFSCKTTVPVQTDTFAGIKAKISGKWLWQQTKVCQRNNPAPETPESCTCKKTLTINAYGTVKLYVDNVEKNSSAYKITVTDLPAGYYFSSDFLSGALTVDENNLSISTCATDGSDFKYTKVK